MTIKKTVMIYFEIFIIVSTILASFVSEVPINFVVTIIIYLIALFYTINKIRKRAAFFTFLIAFFVFLVGRDFVLYYFNYGLDSYSQLVNSYAYNTLSVSLLFMLLTYILFENTYLIKQKEMINVSKSLVSVDLFRKVTLVVYFVILLFSLIFQVNRALFSIQAGYLGLYSEFSSNVTSVPLRILELIEVGLPIPLTLYLATNPNKSRVLRIFGTYFIYLAITLFSGSRATFFLGLLFMFFYIVTRPDYKRFVTRRFIIMLLVSIPLLVLLTMYIQEVRYGNSFELNSMFHLFLDFFEQQGISISTIKLGKVFEEHFPIGKYYLLKFLYSGIIARLFNLPIYYGNNIENALLGNDFNHALSYFALGDAYLNGAGTGTSYIAESMHDGGYLMLIIVSVIYSALLYFISNYNKYNLWVKSVYLVILTSLLWAPRGNGSGFISALISPSALLTLTIIFLLYKSLISLKKMKFSLKKI